MKEIKDSIIKNAFLYAPSSIKNILKIKNIYSLHFHKDIFIKNNFKDIRFLKFYLSAKQMDNDNKLLLKLLDVSLIKISNFFNQKFEIQKTNEFYQALMGYWLIHIISQYIYFSRLLKFINKNNLIPVQIQFSEPINPENSDDYFELINKPIYQNYLFSSFLKISNVKSYTFQKNNHKYIKNYNKNIFNKLIFKIYFLIFKLIKPDTLIIDPYFKNNHLINKFKLTFFSKFKILFLNPRFLLNYDHSKSKKNNLINFNFKDNLLSYIFHNIPNEILLAIEGKLKINFNYIPKKIFTKNSFAISNFHLFHSHNIDKLQVYVGQHGSTHGIFKGHLSEIFERRISSKYFTYGWREDSSTIKFCSQKFKISRTNSDKILFATNNNSVFFLRYQSYYAPFQNEISFVQNPINFIKHSKFKKNIIYRPYPARTHCFDNLTAIKKSIPELLIDKNKDFFDSIINSRVVIFDHLGLAFLEALSVNIPVVLILDPKANHFRESFYKYSKMLIENNILFYSPITASEFINKNFFTFEKHWSSNKLQKDIKEFLSIYYNTDSNWHKVWIESLS